MLKYADPKWEYQVISDASDIGPSAVLTQTCEKAADLSHTVLKHLAKQNKYIEPLRKNFRNISCYKKLEILPPWRNIYDYNGPSPLKIIGYPKHIIQEEGQMGRIHARIQLFNKLYQRKMKCSC